MHVRQTPCWLRHIPSLTLSSPSFCLYLSRAGMTGVSHYAWLLSLFRGVKALLGLRMWAHTKVLVAGPRLQKTFANGRYKGASDLSSPLILSLHPDSSRREKEEPPVGGAISLILTMQLRWMGHVGQMVEYLLHNQKAPVPSLAPL